MTLVLGLGLTAGPPYAQADLPSGSTDHARLLPAVQRSCCAVFLVAFLVVLLSLRALPAAGQATITVNSTADTAVPFDAHCTLREALTNANLNTDTTANDCAAGTSTGTDTIVFNLVLGGGGGGPVRTISPGSALPVITDPVVIDGETFGEADCGSTLASRTLTVILDGSSGAGSGLELGAGSDGSTIRGLVINQWPDSGVRIVASGNNTVACNFIGTDVTGTADLGNTGSGVRIDGGATGNTIGGAVVGAGNLISGNNSRGVVIRASNDNTVAGNYIGTDVTGTAALGNSNSGVVISISATGNTIGGAEAGAGNLISGNNNHGVGIISASNDNTVAGNFIGTDVTGTADLGNTDYGVYINDGATSNTIGGTTAEARNLISGNDYGVVIIIDSDNNTVAGNFIGTDVTGTADLGNTSDGVYINEGTGNTIGGAAVGAGNLISGNNGYGVYIEDSDNNTVAGNFIGTDVTGTADLGNTSIGVGILDGATGNTIGGTTAEARNLISGNNYGVVMTDDNNTVAGNFIGTDVTGTADLGNTNDGVVISFSATDNTIGGAAPGAANTVAFNGQDGVVLYANAGTGNAIRRNSLFSNGQLGIDLGDDGRTPNDPGDGDTGPNKLQNFPNLTAVVIIGGTLLATYSVDTDPVNAAYPITVEVFEADADDEEGETFLGSDSYTTGDYPGTREVILGNAAALGVSLGDRLVATATDDDGNTSEFSDFFVTGTVTRYVATTGNDTANDCTNPGIPCATLGHAVSQANAGDTIDVAAGTYPEPGLVIDKALHIEGAGVVVQ